MRGQLVPAAGASADSLDQEGLVGDKGQVRSFPKKKESARRKRAAAAAPQ